MPRPLKICPDCRALHLPDEPKCLVDGHLLPPATPVKDALKDSAELSMAHHRLGRRAGPFVLRACLGHGGMGAVYLGVHHDEKTVGGLSMAIKVIRGQDALDPWMRTLFLDEARLLSRLFHQHIVRLFDFGYLDGLDQGDPYLTMTYVRGVTLDRELRCAPYGLTPSRAHGILLSIAETLVYLHEKERLRVGDLKTDNVMLECYGGRRDWVWLIDFGIAQRILGSAQGRAAGGALSYMAPELIRHPAQAGLEADIYALGIVTYELFTGTLPFVGTGENARKEIEEGHLRRRPLLLRERRPGLDIPDALEDLVARMLAKDPAARPRAGDVLSGLHEVAPALGATSALSQIRRTTIYAPQIGAPSTVVVPVRDTRQVERIAAIEEDIEAVCGVLLQKVEEARERWEAWPSELAMLHVKYGVCQEQLNNLGVIRAGADHERAQQQEQEQEQLRRRRLDLRRQGQEDSTELRQVDVRLAELAAVDHAQAVDEERAWLERMRELARQENESAELMLQLARGIVAREQEIPVAMKGLIEDVRGLLLQLEVAMDVLGEIQGRRTSR